MYIISGVFFFYQDLFIKKQGYPSRNVGFPLYVVGGIMNNSRTKSPIGNIAEETLRTRFLLVNKHAYSREMKRKLLFTK